MDRTGSWDLNFPDDPKIAPKMPSDALSRPKNTKTGLKMTVFWVWRGLGGEI